MLLLHISSQRASNVLDARTLQRAMLSALHHLQVAENGSGEPDSSYISLVNFIAEAGSEVGIYKAAPLNAAAEYFIAIEGHDGACGPIEVEVSSAVVEPPPSTTGSCYNPYNLDTLLKKSTEMIADINT
eukprot:scaffold215342_cov30-Tisochrysis_lutea.AAC.2